MSTMKENNYFKKKRGHTSLYYSCELMESGQNSLKRNFQHQELQTTLYLFYYSNMFLAIPFFLSLASSLPTDLDFHVFKKEVMKKVMRHNFKPLSLKLTNKEASNVLCSVALLDFQ